MYYLVLVRRHNNDANNGITLKLISSHRSTMTKKKDNKLAKGQKTLSGFVCRLAEKENDMALSSNLRKSSIQRSKSNARSKNKNARNPQKTIEGNDAEPRCDEGTKVCKACEFNEKEKAKGSAKRARFAHDVTCKINSDYKITNGGRISKADYYLKMYEEERMKQLKLPFSGKELHTGGNTQDNVDLFFAPWATDDHPSDVGGEGKTAVTAASIYAQYETPKLIDRINYYSKNPSSYMKKQKSGSVPLVVLSAIQALLDFIPDQFKRDGSNDLMGLNNPRWMTHKKLLAYRLRFPNGTVGFTFPRADKSLPPDFNYSQLEGRTIYFCCWEVNIQGWQPTCFDCGDTMIHDAYDFQTRGYATPIFDVSGTTDYVVSMQYGCPKCGNRCKSSDGRILMQVPLPKRSGFKVDPRYTVNKERYLSLSFTRMMDKMFITHGNGDQLAMMLNELRGDSYLDMEEEYYTQAIASGLQDCKQLPAFETFIGRYSHSGDQLRDLKDEAAVSTLLSTGVSDFDRVRREIQSVGCNKLSSSDHTWEFLKNYKEGLFPKGTTAGHSMGNNNGEVASLAINSMRIKRSRLRYGLIGIQKYIKLTIVQLLSTCGRS